MTPEGRSGPRRSVPRRSGSGAGPPGSSGPDRSARLASLLAAVEAPAGAAADDVRARLDGLAKPPGSLGRLEDLAVRLAVVRGDPPPSIARPVAFVLAADHGVARRGVSAYPAEVTARMCRAFGSEGAAVNVLGASVGCAVVAVDVGVDADLESVEGIVRRKVRRGTADLAAGPAMSRAEAVSAILVGAEVFGERSPSPDAVVLGEMGIGSSTSAGALTAALTGVDPAKVVGPGTGVRGRPLERKHRVVRRAVERSRSSAGGGGDDPLGVLHEVGGLEIAGLVGVALAAAAAKTPVVVDGFIATAAAAVAVRLAPSSRAYLFAGHRSPEPGHDVLLDDLGLEPVLDLDLRLGEGTGAVLALPILDAAGAILRRMATLESLGLAGGEGP